ncbi:putative secreted protein [Rhodopirellula sp. SWK7]|nr:putative secreted protein [Rhodopirellula sp. SWK7]
MTIGMLGVAGILGYSCSAVEADENRKVNRHGQHELTLADLPEPPADLKPLIKKGNITFLIGGDRPSVVNPSRSTSIRGRRFDAETQFRLSYSFKSRCRWGWDGASTSRRLAIDVGFSRLRIEVRHLMWFLNMPDRETFWESPLVRHEFDHVRLSSDPRVSSQFVSAVRKHDRIELSREDSEDLLAEASRRAGRTQYKRGGPLSTLTGTDAHSWLTTIVQAEFDRTVELVGIRYQELDRQTDHGRYDVPETGELREWLQR